ncbi:MAG: GH3 auxin-responsive promoter family protein [Butyrivibrio sp.]|nr:GH3 auxin-responsive promoter family protein [Butyrivibrio sp.]
MNKEEIKASVIRNAAGLVLNIPVSNSKYRQFMQEAKTEQMAVLLNQMSLPGLYRMQRRLFNDCERVQKTILYEIIRANENTEFGKAHHFSEFNGIKGYRKNVPISEWDDYSEAMEALEKGKSDVLFPGKAEYFYVTSGTTGNCKRVPESSRDTAIREVVGRIKNIEKAVACDIIPEYIMKNFKVFALTSKLANEQTEGGIPVGSASGRTASLESGGGYSKLMACPTDLPNYYDDEDYNYMMLRISLCYRNVGIIMGNNAAFMENIIHYGEAHAKELIDDIRSGGCKLEVPDELKDSLKDVMVPLPERANELEALRREGKFIPKYYWPNLKLASFWLGGSVGVNVKSLRPLLPNKAKFMDLGYGSSEAKINIPLEADTPSGALMTYTEFFEFIPEEGGEPLMAHELEADKDYEVLLTTNSGLYRYRIHDIVHVDGFIGNTPLLHFATKAGDIANIAQEKLYGSVLSPLIKDSVADRFKVKALQVYPDAEAKKYFIYIEPETELSEADKSGLSEKVDEYLKKNSHSFGIVRGWAMEAPEVMIMPKGWGELIFEEYAEGKPNRSQVKVPVVRKTPYIAKE